MVTKKQRKLNISYGEDFLTSHVGRIISDPNFALIELVANSWDAGADNNSKKNHLSEC